MKQPKHIKKVFVTKSGLNKAYINHIIKTDKNPKFRKYDT
jgi:hypothetical protein